jgi:hypothetical protein
MVYVVMKHHRCADYKVIAIISEKLERAEAFVREKGEVLYWDKKPGFYPLGWVKVVQPMEGCDYTEEVIYTIEEFELLK